MKPETTTTGPTTEKQRREYIDGTARALGFLSLTDLESQLQAAQANRDKAWTMFEAVEAESVERETAYAERVEGLERERDALREAQTPLKSFAQWIVALDTPDSTERRTITLTKIIEAAEAALRASTPSEGDE